MRKDVTGLGVEDRFPLEEIEKDWEYIRTFTNEVNENGFPMFMGYEWQGAGLDGDHNVFLKNNNEKMEYPLRYTDLVNAYAKYHAKGFEIFSVSLDNNKTNWLNAIAEDKLAWENHGSNLQGWRCPIVKEYNISTIPSSVLIDKEGKIIGINLRGQDLENALANVFK